MLLNILLLLLLSMHSHGKPPREKNWIFNYRLYTKGDEYARAINGKDFDAESYAIEMPLTECRYLAPLEDLIEYRNKSGYIYCVSSSKIIPQPCPSGTEVSFELGGCVNKTTNTTVFPVGSRCASQPCQNGGRCFDLSLADAYYCACHLPYTGLHCHIQEWSCPPSSCGVRTPEMVPLCSPYTSDRALRYSCRCYMPVTSNLSTIALNNCYDKNQLFAANCNGEREVGAVSFTNKAYYICTRLRIATLEPCWLNHVWNNTLKKCVPENI